MRPFWGGKMIVFDEMGRWRPRRETPIIVILSVLWSVAMTLLFLWMLVAASARGWIVMHYANRYGEGLIEVGLLAIVLGVNLVALWVVTRKR